MGGRTSGTDETKGGINEGGIDHCDFDDADFDDDGFDLADFTPYLLNIAAERESLEFSAVYRRRYGMTRPEWRVLFHLGRYGPMTATGIGRRAHIHKTKISRAVGALEGKRCLRRETVDRDRRSDMLELLPRGHEVYRDLTLHAARFEASLRARLGARDADTLRRILARLAR